MRIWSRNILFYIVKITGLYYKSPANLNYWWNFGFLSLFFLFVQIFSGIFLAMFYLPDPELAFTLVYKLTNEVYYGWWVRNIHSNGASFFFLVVYIHMARGFYYGSYLYPRQAVWVSGVIIWLLMVATAFLGYILPWGQMSFWGAMVITSLLAAIPLIGSDLIFLLWGSFSIDKATLNRFYSLHFALPFVILMVSIVHIVLLHEFGSNNPLGISAVLDNIPFVPYYTLKDIFSLVFVTMIFVTFIALFPDLLGHYDNFILANPLVTPPHIVPEWYFLPLYAVLRSVPSKGLGLLAILCFVLVILFLPFIHKGMSLRSSMFRPIYAMLNWIFFCVVIALGWIGSLPILSPYYEIGQILTFLYFLILLVLLPLCGYIEKLLYMAYAIRYRKLFVRRRFERTFKKIITLEFKRRWLASNIAPSFQKLSNKHNDDIISRRK